MEYYHDFAPHVIGGSSTSANQYPWMVRLTGPGGFCGGSLISNQHVLTAKHCVNNVPMEWALVGIHDVNEVKDRQKVPILTAVWPDDTDHDMAIVILEEPVTLEDTIQPICLPGSEDFLDYMGTDTIALGWGMTGVGSKQSDVLKQVPRLMIISSTLL